MKTDCTELQQGFFTILALFLSINGWIFFLFRFFDTHYLPLNIRPHKNNQRKRWLLMSTTSGSRSVIGPLCMKSCITQIGT